MPSKNYPKGILRVWLSMAIVLSVFLSGHFYQFVFEWEAHIESNDQPTTIAATAVRKQSALPVDKEPPCNTSGTHYFYRETYVSHPNSESFRHAMQEELYNYHPSSDTGILYAVSGTHEYIESAFVPVIQHLRETLKIPNASQRQLQVQKQQNQQSQQQQQWSLAMDPYTCNFLYAEHASTLSFFDVLVIVTKQDLLQHYKQANNPTKSHIPTRRKRKRTSYNYSQIIFDHDEYEQQEAEKLATWSTQELEQRRKKRTKSTVSGKNVLGVVSWGDRANFKLRHYVKAIKLHALVEAAFPMTIFIDVDMVPCYKDFGRRLLEDVVAMAAVNQSQNTFDIAVTDVNPTYGLKHPDHNDPTHYLLSRRFNSSEENNGNDSNIHNSMCMALNITSPKTQEFLRKATEHFFSLTNQKTQSKIKVQTVVDDAASVTDAPSPIVTIDLKTRDQPSLGEAMYETWKHYYQPPSNITTNEGESSITAADGFKHVDMDIEKVCRNVQIYTTRLKQACPNLDANGNAVAKEKDNQCLLVHKTTGEGPDSRAVNRKRRRENAKKKKKAAAAN